jgi:hypothetical protein
MQVLPMRQTFCGCSQVFAVFLGIEPAESPTKWANGAMAIALFFGEMSLLRLRGFRMQLVGFPEIRRSLGSRPLSLGLGSVR